MDGRWSYGYRGSKETRTVLITEHVASNLGLVHGTILRFTGPPVRSLEDMSGKEISAIESEYGCRVVGGRFEWGLA